MVDKRASYSCSGKDCGNPAVYSVKVELSSSQYYWCDKCRDMFAASLNNVPEDRREALLKDIVIAPLEAVNAPE